MAIRFEITGDNSNVLHSFEGTRKGVQQMSKDVEKSGASIEGMFNRIRNAAAMALAGLSGKELAQQMVSVRGEFQKLEISFKTMLGAERPAIELMDQLVKTAATTPFDLKGIASGAKQLLAYGMEAEKVNDIIVRLGDIAAGLDQPLGDLIYLYGTTMAQGRMYMMDLNQFMGRGIPMVGELAKIFGVAENEVRDLVTEGKVGFEQLDQVIRNLTSDGGRFGGLMKEQSASWPGQISNIGDAIDTMFNEIGKKNESIVNGTLEVVSSLVENYEQVGRVLTGLVATYGTYKVAVMTVSAVQSVNSMITRQAAIEKSLAAAATITLSDAEAVAAAKTKIFSIVVNKARLSVAALGKTMLANPYVLAATAITAIVAGYMSMETEAERLRHAEERYNEEREKSLELDKKRKEQAEQNMQIAENEGNATDTRKDALRRLMSLYPEVFAKYDTEYERLKHIRDIKLEIANIEKRKSEDSLGNELSNAKERLAQLQSKIRNSGLGTGVLSSKEYSEFKFLLGKVGSLQKSYDKQQDSRLFNDKYSLEAYKRRIAKGEDKNSLIAEIDRHIASYTNLESKMKMSGRKSGSFAGSSAEYTLEELEALKIRLRDVRNELNAPTHNTAEWIDIYREKLKNAEKDLAEFKKNKDAMSEEEFQKGIKDRQSAISLAKKQYQELGETTQSKAKENKSREKQINAKRELEDEMLRLERENQRTSVEIMDEGRKKRLAEIENEYNEREDAIHEHERKLKEANLKTYGNDTLTEEQNNLLQEMQRNNILMRQKANAELLEEDNAAMLEYLKAYGSMMQQKAAITEEYDEKISKAQSDGERKMLEKQKGEALAQLDLKELKDKIDWTKVFGNLDEVSEETLRNLKQTLIKFINDSENLGIEAKKDIIEAITDINDEIAERKPFKALGDTMNVLHDTTIELKEAQEAYNKALKEGTAEEQKNAKETLNSARDKNLKAKIDATTALRNSASKAREYVDTVDALANLLYTFGVNPPQWISDFIGGMDQMLSGLEKIDLTKPMTAITGSIDALSGLMKSVFSFGGAINFNNSNAREVQRTIDRLTDRNEKLQTAVEDLTEEMALGRGAKSVSAYKDAREYQSEINKNLLEIAKAQAGYHGSHHSWSHYWGGFTPEEMEWIRANVNADFNGDIFSLTPEEMKKLRANIELWKKIQETGKGGYGDRLTEKLDEYIEQAGKLEELTNKLYEGLTGITFDNVYDNFIDMLMRLEDPTKEAAENLGEIFMKAMLSYRISAMFEEDLKKWWEAFGMAMESDGLDAKEKESLLQQYLDMLKNAQDIRDEVADILGYNIGGATQQGATKQGFATASQESIDILSGRALSNQITLNNIDNNILAVFGKITAMAEISTSNNIYLADIRTMMLSANNYLDDIAKYAKLVYVQFGSKLDSVISNTKNI